MNQKEVRELKRRFLPNKNAISRIYGCYVDPNRRIIAQLDESLGLMPEDEAEKAAAVLTEEMRSAAQLSVPLIADAGIGKSWFDAKAG